MANAEPGQRAPDFTLDSTEGEITLSRWLAERGRDVLLVFYPGDDTPVCTKQLCDYSENLGVFEDLGVDVLAINPQSLGSHRRFANKHGLSFPLCTDPDKRVCRAYGALGFLGTAKRALVLVDRDGAIRWRRTDLPIFHRSTAQLQDELTKLARVSNPA